MNKILIIYGGNSFEHDISCMSAKNMCKCLESINYNYDKVYISKENKWFLIRKDGKAELLNVVEFLKKYELILPIMHGAFGEDGKIQALFELFNIKYIGSNSSSSMLAMNKYLTKLLIEKNDIKQIPYFILNKSSKVPKNIEYPVIVKPVNGGSSIGISIAHSRKELKAALNFALLYDQDVIVEKFINGIDLECGIIKTDKLIVGDVGEVRHQHEFYDFDAKYNDKSEIIIPANISNKLAKEIKKTAVKIFNIMNLNDFARIDFIFDKENNDLYFNEVNTIPGFTDTSMFTLLFNSKKSDFSKLIAKIIKNKIDTF